VFFTFICIEYADTKATSSEYLFSELTTYEAEYLFSPELQRKYGQMSTTMHLDQMIRRQDNDVVK
jgi:hypothetical protein